MTNGLDVSVSIEVEESGHSRTALYSSGSGDRPRPTINQTGRPDIDLLLTDRAFANPDAASLTDLAILVCAVLNGVASDQD